MRNFLKILLGFVALLVVVVVARTMLHQPATETAVQPIDVAVDDALIAEHLSQAIQMPTVSFETASEGDVQVFNAFIDWVKATYPEVNQVMTLEQLEYTLLYKWQGSDPTLQPILLTGHYDVVPVIPGTEDLWLHPPFGGEIHDGVIWGRGALDDKSAVVAMLEAATWLIQQGFAPERTVYFSFGHDEERGGGAGAAAVAEYLARAKVQLAWSLDEGSFLFDKMLPGVERLMAAINVAEKGSVTLAVVAKGAGGHSSMPPQQTAVGVLAQAITKLENQPVPGGLEGLSLDMFDVISRDMPFVARMMFANRWLFGNILEEQLAQQTFTNAMLRTTTAPTMLSASIKANVLPIEATAIVNFRVHPRDSVQGVVDYVTGLVGNENVSVSVSGRGGRGASTVSDKDSAGFKLIGQAVQEVYGDVLIVPGLMIAASDTVHYSQVADNSFRFNPMVVTSSDLTGFHGTNEKISVANLVQGTRTYVQVLRHGAH